MAVARHFVASMGFPDPFLHLDPVSLNQRKRLKWNG